MVPLSVPAPLTAVAAAGSGVSLMDLMMLNMIQQQQQQFRVSAVPGIVAAPAPAAATHSHSVGSAPQSPAKFRLPNIPLAAFCERYNITSTDQERLEKLEFLPGDRIDKLSEERRHVGLQLLYLSLCPFQASIQWHLAHRCTRPHIQHHHHSTIR